MHYPAIFEPLRFRNLTLVAEIMSVFDRPPFAAEVAGV
jgi:hypothetical protein